MQDTQKQSARDEAIRFTRECLAKLPEQIDSLIEGYRIMKKLRPAYAREYLISIEDFIRDLRFYEAELARLEANPDCPF